VPKSVTLWCAFTQKKPLNMSYSQIMTQASMMSPCGNAHVSEIYIFTHLMIGRSNVLLMDFFCETTSRTSLLPVH
jgi:hypothetical protein